MNGPFLTFMLVPCTAAILAGWALRHWALAAAATAGGLGFVYLFAQFPLPLTKFVAPMATAAMVSGLVLIPALLLRPSISVWNRMMITLGAVFLTHLAFLQYVLSNR